MGVVRLKTHVCLQRYLPGPLLAAERSLHDQCTHLHTASVQTPGLQGGAWGPCPACLPSLTLSFINVVTLQILLL